MGHIGVGGFLGHGAAGTGTLLGRIGYAFNGLDTHVDTTFGVGSVLDAYVFKSP